MKTRTLQEIFDAVIKSGWYRSRKPLSRNLMCHALELAAGDGIITYMEYCKAKKSITTYLKGYRLLCTALYASGYGVDPNYTLCKAIYSCWSARPKLKYNIS